MPYRILKTIGLLTILLTALPLFTTWSFAQDAKSSDKTALEAKKEQPPPGLAELVSRGTAEGVSRTCPAPTADTSKAA